jgi:hypothetical protein
MEGLSLAGKSPAPEVGSIVAWLVPPDESSRCLVVDLSLGAIGKGTLPAFDSCGDDKAVTWLRDNRGLTGAVVWLTLGLGVAWWAWRTYAPGATGVA